MHAASYVFGSDGIVNQTGGWNTGLAFLFGLLSVQWTVSSAGGYILGVLTSIIDDRESGSFKALKSEKAERVDDRIMMRLRISREWYTS
jgi:hypothetical protein